MATPNLSVYFWDICFALSPLYLRKFRFLYAYLPLARVQRYTLRSLLNLLMPKYQKSFLFSHLLVSFFTIADNNAVYFSVRHSGAPRRTEKAAFEKATAVVDNLRMIEKRKPKKLRAYRLSYI